jgi:hypothetical protein
MLDRIDREIELSGPLDDDAKAKLLEIADKCPVHRRDNGGSCVSVSHQPLASSQMLSPIMPLATALALGAIVAGMDAQRLWRASLVLSLTAVAGLALIA